VFGDPCPNTPKYLEVHYKCVLSTATTTKEPLPPWFLEGGGNHLWDSRIPDPPEGFEMSADLKSAHAAGMSSGGQDEVSHNEDDIAFEQRIPITTPSVVLVSSTSTTERTTAQPQTSTTTVGTTEKQSASTVSYKKSTYSQADSDVDDMLEYFPLTTEEEDESVDDSSNSDSEVSVRIVDIPPAGAERPHHCPPAETRGGLAWNWTASGQTVAQLCPPGSTGLARWTCRESNLAAGSSSVAWLTATPDLGDCKTLAMSRLEGQVQANHTESVVSAALAQLTRTQAGGLFGGDIEAAVAIMRTLANRILFLLQTKGNSFHNKGAYIQEVLLNMVGAASNLLDGQNRAAWRDLSPGRQIKAASGLLTALEENALFLAEVTSNEEIILETAKNIRKSC